MHLLPTTLGQRVVGGVLHQGVLKGVHRVRPRALLERQPRFDEVRERLIQFGRGMGRDGGDQLVAELAPDRRADLRDLLDRRETIETRHQ